MKLAHPPRMFSFILISFTFLLIQFGVVNHFIAIPNQSRYYSPEITQSIPDTNASEIVILEKEPSPLTSTSIFTEPAYPSEVERFTELDEPRSPGSHTSDPPAEDYSAQPVTSGPVPLNIEDGPSLIPYVDAMGGAASVVAENSLDERNHDPEFEMFVEEVTNGDPETITGIYAAGLFSLRVLQQPPQDLAFVSTEDGTATQFQSPSQFGVLGMLAHNFLSGKLFFSLTLGQEIRIIFGSGSYRSYRVSNIADFERLTRFDIRSDFRDLQSNDLLSSKDMFARFYQGDNFLTLQTCLEGNGYSNWGVRMISAVPVN